MTEKKKLYLIDGTNYIFRAYYAIASLSNSKGFPTNALYAFTQMILKFLNDKKPEYLAVIFDTKAPTFRDELYKEYKANRKEPPDDLKEQFPYFKPILEALNVCVLEKDGYEADDLIGTIAKKEAEHDFEIVILTGDKDMMQLVDPNIIIYDSMKDRYFNSNEVKKRFEVGPEKVVDVMGLAGDSSDNIPGIPGVGPKTASKLIKDFGSLDNILSNLDKLTKNIAKKIYDNKDLAKLSTQLVTIDISVPIKYNLEDFLVKDPNLEKLRELFEKLEFNKLLSTLAPEKKIDNSNYRIVNTEKELIKWRDKIQKKALFVFDIESTSLNIIDAEIVGISLCLEPGNACYIPVGHKKHEQENLTFFNDLDLVEGQISLNKVLEIFKPLFESETIKKIGQNVKYDASILKHYNVNIRGIYFDTMIASYLLNPGGKHNLDTLSQQYLGHKKITYEELVLKGKKKKSFAEVEIEKAKEYSCEDADTTFRLYEIFLSQIKEQSLDQVLFDMEMPLVPVLMNMEIVGIKVDKEVLDFVSKEFEEKISLLQNKIYKQASQEFNINSPKQLGKVIFEDLKLGKPKKTKTGYSTDIKVLQDLSLIHEFPNLILEYRSLSKLKSTYTDSLPALINKNTKRVHTSFNQTITATGRLSSSNPNLQNIPIRTEEGKRIRKAFVAEPGNLLISADYSQIELRVLAHLSLDKNLVNAFRENVDVHTLTAAGIFDKETKDVTKEERSIGKTVNFATIYGQSPYGLSSQLKTEVDEAKAYIGAYFAKYPKVETYRDEILKKAQELGYVETFFGRKRFVPDINSSNVFVKQATERMAFNAVFQGTAADIIKKAMVELDELLPKKYSNAYMLLQVHDELIFEVSEKQAKDLSQFVKNIMENIVKLNVPLIVDVGIGKNWLEAH